VLTARYALSPYIKQICFVFKGLKNTGFRTVELLPSSGERLGRHPASLVQYIELLSFSVEGLLHPSLHLRGGKRSVFRNVLYLELDKYEMHHTFFMKNCPCPSHEGLWGEFKYSATHFSALDGSKWSYSRPGRFTPRKEPRYLLEIGWASEPVWTSWRGEASLAAARIDSLYSPARSLRTITITSQFLIWVLYITFDKKIRAVILWTKRGDGEALTHCMRSFE
jgi:hypothetical protein